MFPDIFLRSEVERCLRALSAADTKGKYGFFTQKNNEIERKYLFQYTPLKSSCYHLLLSLIFGEKIHFLKIES